MSVIIITTSLVTAMLLIRWTSRKNIFDPRVWLYAFLLAGPLITYVFFDVMAESSWRNFSSIDRAAVGEIALQTSCFVLMSIGLDVLFRRTRSIAIYESVATESAHVNGGSGNILHPVIISTSLIGSVFLFSVFLVIMPDALVRSDDLADKYGSSSFVLLVAASYLAGAAIGMSNLQRNLINPLMRTSVAIWCFFLVIIFLLGFLQRYLAVSIILSWLFSRGIAQEIKVGSIKRTTWLAVGGALIAVSLFALIRPIIHAAHMVGFFDVSIFERMTMFEFLGLAVGSSDLVHPTITAAELIRAPHFEYGAAEFFGSLRSIAPVSLRGDEISEAQSFARYFYPSFAAEGGGTGFSLVGSLVVAFGYFVGPLLGCFFIFLLLSIIASSARRLRKRVNFIGLAYLSCPLTFLFLERLGATAFLKQLIFQVALVGMVYLFSIVFVNFVPHSGSQRKL